MSLMFITMMVFEIHVFPEMDSWNCLQNKPTMIFILLFKFLRIFNSDMPTFMPLLIKIYTAFFFFLAEYGTISCFNCTVIFLGLQKLIWWTSGNFLNNHFCFFECLNMNWYTLLFHNEHVKSTLHVWCVSSQVSYSSTELNFGKKRSVREASRGRSWSCVYLCRS